MTLGLKAWAVGLADHEAVSDESCSELRDAIVLYKSIFEPEEAVREASIDMSLIDRRQRNGPRMGLAVMMGRRASLKRMIWMKLWKR